MIRKVPGTNKYIVKSKTGKNLSKPMSHTAAVRRLHQIEFFKHHKK